MTVKVPDGYTAKYKHVRRAKQPDQFWFKFDYNPSHEVDPLGGTTICTLVKDGVERAKGVARCHPNDNYNKKIGRDIALGRAIKALESQRGVLDPAQSVAPRRFTILRQA